MLKIPGVNHLEAVRALEKAGFTIIRQVVIPRNNLIQAFTMGGIVKDAGLTPDEFKDLL